MARPRKVIDPKIVEAMALLGAPNTDIAAFVGCHEAQIRRRFADVTAKARASRRTKLREKQWELAMNGNAVMCIWLGKQDLGQSDKLESKQETTVILEGNRVDTSPKTDQRIAGTLPVSDN